MKIKITHLILEFFDCKGRLSEAIFIQNMLRNAASESGLSILHSYFHSFERAGVTGVILLKESHISIHTWPEHNYAAVDVFTCGSRKDALRVYRSLVESLQPQRVNKKEIRHGIAK